MIEKLKQIGKLTDVETEEGYNRVLVCNNACWAIGMIAGQVQDLVKPLVKDIINNLSAILDSEFISELSQKNEQLLKHLAKTVSLTLGRLGLIDPQQTAFCLPKIIRPWCLALRYINNSDEKASAFKGLCAMIPFNPIGIAESFPYFCEALIEFDDAPQDLEYTFQNLIFTYKQCLGPLEWNKYIESFPPQLKAELNTRFKLGSNDLKVSTTTKYN